MNKVIDFSAHVMIPDIEEYMRLKGIYEPNTLEDRIKVMDRYGVDIQVVHLSAAHLYGLNAEETSKVCVSINDYIYKELTSKKPDRFIGCGTLNIQDVDFSLRELDRVLDRGFRCVTMPTHQGSIGLEDPSILPLLKEISERKLVLFTHPISWEGYQRAEEKNFMAALGWPFETSLAMWRLIVGGILDELPKLKIVTHHLGSTFPYYKDRIERWMKRYRGNQFKPLSAYAGQLYADTALDGFSPADLLIGYSFFGSKGLLFGSDWPFGENSVFVGQNLDAVKTMPIPEAERNRILYDNAHDLLGL